MTKLYGVGLVLLGACGTSSSSSDVVNKMLAEAPTIDRAEFATASSIPENLPPNVTGTATGDGARAIYEATLELPELGAGPYNCPADFGITYQLTFFAGDQQVVAGTIEPAGCEITTLSGNVGSASLGTNSNYWGTLATDFGIQESLIYPYRPAS